MISGNIKIIDKNRSDWSTQIDNIRESLGAPNNPFLFPAYYLKATFPKIGGKIAIVTDSEQLHGVGFLFPRDITNGVKEYTIRYHKPLDSKPADLSEDAGKELIELFKSTFPNDEFYLYQPAENHSFFGTKVEEIILNSGEILLIKKPLEEEAKDIRDLQRETWQGPPEDDLYPADIHCPEFKTATSLIGTIADKSIGFLFGFYKFADSNVPEAFREKFRTDFRIESQLAGVKPEYRRHSVAFQLKRTQAIQAAKNNVDIINWTVDPLQYANAVLNFNKLKAICYTFYPSYYTFQNPLNSIPTSRFELTLLLRTSRVMNRLNNISEQTSLELDQSAHILNIEANLNVAQSDADQIAIEIPNNWTELQKNDAALSEEWKKTTDKIFSQYVGHEEGKYIVVAAKELSGRKYLLAKKVNVDLLMILSS